MNSRVTNKTLIVLFLALVPGSVVAADEPFMAGMSVVDITPPAERIAGPLKARCVVFRQGQAQAAVVVGDVGYFTAERSGAARKLISDKTGIPVSNIVVVATHTHSGAWHEGVTEKIVEAVVQAQSMTRPAELAQGIATQEGLAFNRRFLMKDGTVRFNPGRTEAGISFDGGHPFLNPDIVRPVGPTDPAVGLVLIRDADTHRPQAVLVNFAMHVCTVGSGRISGDYPYFLDEALRRDVGAGFLSVFLGGCSGDVNHYDVSKPGPQMGHMEQAQPTGEKLATTVQASLPTLKCVARPSLAMRSTTIELPLQVYSDGDLAWAREAVENEFKDFGGSGYGNPGFLAGIRARKILMLEKLHQKGPTVSLEIQVLRLDEETAIAFLPSEIFVELGLSLKKASPFANTLVCELANDLCHYVPGQKSFIEGGYEVVNSWLAPGGGERLVESAVQLLKDLDAPGTP
ncbi:MAG: hypothetical protein ACYC6N_27720 [Pirellulaceae bacterium]